MQGVVSRFFERKWNSLFVKPYKKLFSPLVRRRICASEKFIPQAIVTMNGGLGSQMWQYALGRGIRVISGLPVCYDLSWYEKSGMDINRRFSRAYRLESVFPNVAIQRASRDEIRRYRLYFDRYPGARFDFCEEILSSKNARYMSGSYVNAKYVDFQGGTLRDEFLFKLDLSGENARILASIQSAPLPVAVHVRRGDFVGSGHDVTTIEYFRNAIDLVTRKFSPEKPMFFVFSNDMGWVRENFHALDGDFFYADANGNDDGACDMYLMSECAHFIISNSSFGWWSAWLSRRSGDKLVVMPDRWTRREKERLTMMAKGWQALPAE